MPEEPPKQIEELLRAYARERRKDFDPTVPPAVHQAFRNEVDRVVRAAPAKIGAGAALRKFWPQFSIAASASLALVASLYFYENRLKQQELASIRSDDSEGISSEHTFFLELDNTEKKDSPPAVALRSEPTSPPGPLSEPPGQPSASTPISSAKQEIQQIAPKETSTFNRSAPAVVLASPPEKQLATTRENQQARNFSNLPTEKPSAVLAEARSSSPRLESAMDRLAATKVPSEEFTETSQSLSAGNTITAEPEKLADRAVAALANAATSPPSPLRSPGNNPGRERSVLSKEQNKSEVKAVSSGSAPLPKTILEVATAGVPSSQGPQASLALSYREAQTPVPGQMNQGPPPSAPRHSFVNQAPQNKSPVLQNFQLVYLRPIINLVDADGSVYTGSVVQAKGPGNPDGYAKGSGEEEQHRAANFQNSKPTLFRVQGMNRSLQQPVVVNGHLLEVEVQVPSAPAQPEKSKKVMSPKEATQQSRQSSFQAVPAAEGLNVYGTIKIGRSNSFPFQATSPETSRRSAP